jgi:hypothetical protein
MISQIYVSISNKVLSFSNNPSYTEYTGPRAWFYEVFLVVFYLPLFPFLLSRKGFYFFN